MERNSSLEDASVLETNQVQSSISVPHQHAHRSSVLLGDAALPGGTWKKRKNLNVEHITAPQFWFAFRSNLYIIVPIAFVIAFLLPWFNLGHHSNKTDSFLISGSTLSMLGTVLVLTSYVHVCPWRRHPSSLILFRSMVNFVFSCLVFLNATLGTDRDACTAMSFLNQFTLFAGELWVLTISLDLLTSLTNPFSSYRSNLRMYHSIVWVCALANAAILIRERQCQGISREGFCWIAEGAKIGQLNFRSCLWGFFLFWSLLFYMVAVGIICFAYRRLSSGLESTYITREAVMFDTFRVVFCFLSYAFVIGMLFVILEFILPENQRTLKVIFENIFAFTVACRGFVDALVWFFLHRFTTSGPQTVSIQASLIRNPWCCCRRNDLKSAKNSPRDDYRQQQSNGMPWKASTESLVVPLVPGSFDDQQSRTVTTSGAVRDSMDSVPTSVNTKRPAALQDDNTVVDWQHSDIDLTPQLNVALRKEVIHFITEGIKDSVRRWAIKEVQSARRNSFSSMNSSSRFGGNDCVLDNVMASSESATSNLHVRNEKRRESVQDSVNSKTARDHPSYTNGPLLSTQTDHASSAQTFHNRESSYSLRFGSGIHSVVSAASSLLGHRIPGEYGADTNARLWAFYDEVNFGNDDLEPLLPPAQNDSGEKEGLDSQESPMDAPVVLPAEIVFDLDEKHRFRDFRPATFRTLRMLCGITNEWYLSQLDQPIKEQLTEGASNAFLFYAGNLIVKTVTHRESRVLLRILDQYREHLRTTPNSLLVRFFGLHALTFYGREFMFVVMRNIFPPKLVINERFDIKGSFVDRRASLPPPGKTKLCRHCCELFVVGSGERCPEIIGPHEANVVFKDSDMINKIRLRPEDSYEVIDVLERDSDALCAMGIMDYSLLIGVRNQQYEIDVPPSSSGGGPALPIRRRSSMQSLRPSFSVAPELLRSQPMGPSSSDATPRGSFGGAADLEGSECTNGVPGDSRLGRGLPARAVVAPSNYYLGIVDILQTWSLDKQLERIIKTQVLWQNPDGISCMEPDAYRRRFQKKISQIIEHAIFVREVTGSWIGNRVLGEPLPLLDNPNDSDESSECHDLEAH